MSDEKVAIQQVNYNNYENKSMQLLLWINSVLGKYLVIAHSRKKNLLEIINHNEHYFFSLQCKELSSRLLECRNLLKICVKKKFHFYLLQTLQQA